jgi:predicted Zn-dependent protease
MNGARSWLLLLAISVAACSNDEGGSTNLFGPGVEQIILEVDYEAGAAPFDAYPRRDGSPWELLEDNLEALFAQSTPRRLIVPKSLSEMQGLGALSSGPDFTTSEILEIAAASRDIESTESSRSFYIVFLDGFFEDQAGRQEQVLGVSIADTGVIAMFKPVVGTSEDALSRFVEQTTLIHEIGHAVGLVNNGLAPASDHVDEENGAHCTNDRCVMYWLNERIADAIQFARERFMGEDTVVFGQECLDDAYAAAQ